MCKKAWCTCKIVVLLIKPIAFVAFPLVTYWQRFQSTGLPNNRSKKRGNHAIWVDWAGVTLPASGLVLVCKRIPLGHKLTSLMIKAKSKQNSGTSMEETGQYNVKGNYNCNGVFAACHSKTAMLESKNNPHRSRLAFQPLSLDSLE